MTLSMLYKAMLAEAALALDQAVLGALKKEAERLRRAGKPARGGLQMLMAHIGMWLVNCYTNSGIALAQEFTRRPPVTSLHHKALALSRQTYLQGLLRVPLVCEILGAPKTMDMQIRLARCKKLSDQLLV